MIRASNIGYLVWALTVWVSAVGAWLMPASAVGAELFPTVSLERIPRGAVSLTPTGPTGGRPIDAAILENPAVTGVVLVGKWPEIELVEGQYDWSYFDREIARAEAAGKVVLLKITAGGINTPPWVMAEVAQTFSFVDSNPFHDTFNQTVTFPVFWDPAFLEKKMEFIAAMGAKFSENPTVVTVGSPCVNAITGDWNIPAKTTEEADQWLALGYTSEKLIQACIDTLDSTMAAFPHTLVNLAVGGNSNRRMDPETFFVADALLEYSESTYPGRLIAQKGSLAATTPDPTLVFDLRGWDVLHRFRPYVAGQMVWFATEDATCRMNGGVAPCAADAVLAQAIRIGLRYGLLWQEIYEKDLLNPALATVVDAAAQVGSPAPDLTGLITKIKRKAKADGEKLVVKVTVDNPGMEASGPVVVSLFLSDDPVFDEDDRWLQAFEIDNVNPGKFKKPKDGQRKFKVRGLTPAGGQFAIVVIDEEDEVAEGNDENNVLRQQIPDDLGAHKFRVR